MISLFLIVVYTTILRRHGGYRRELNLHLFRACREAWNNFSAKNWLNVLLNKEEKILTPADAFEKITQGDYFDMNRIVHYSPNEVILRSYQLGYEIDTKGFYQPVYYFHLESPDGKYQTDIMSPAMK